MLNTSTNKETTRKATSKFWRRSFIFGLILLIPLGVVKWICLFHDTPLKISKETTYITEPLTADGKRVDYFLALEQELYPPTMKTDDNGYRLIVRAFGPMIDSFYTETEAAILAQQVYDKLGLDPKVKPTLTYEDPSDFLQRYQDAQIEKEENENSEANLEDIDLSPMTEEESEAYENLDEKTYRPWTLEALPMMDQWLKQNDPALNVVGEAVRKPDFCQPLTRYKNNPNLFANPLPEVQQYRGYARGFTARANYRIGTGDLDGAIDDIISCHALGRQIGKKGSLTEILVGIAIEGMAKSIGITGSLEHQPKQAQLQRLTDGLRKLPPPPSMKNTDPYERYSILDIIQMIVTTELRKGIGHILTHSHHDLTFLDRIAAQSTRVLGFNWNVVINRLNAYYDNPDKLEELRNRVSTSNRPLYMSLNALSPISRSKILADYLAIELLTSLNYAEAFNRRQCSDNVYAISLAILLYEKQHGRLPPAYTVDQDGKPLHSWRVLLLPYLGEKAKELYAKIRLDEPWDSEHNRQFHDAAVAFYQCPSAELKPGQTIYSVVVGKKAAFQAGEGKTFDQLGPESANMILVLENPATPACWMDPTTDLTEATAPNVLDTEASHTRIHACLRNGSITSVSQSLDNKTFPARPRRDQCSLG